MEKQTLEVNVKRFLEKRGKNQVWLAKKMGISGATINKMLLHSDPRLSNCQRMAGILGVGLDELTQPDEQSTAPPPGMC